jgi:hypothetical protein
MVRVIDDRGRLFGKVNIVDILVLVVVAALVAFVAIRVTDTGSNSAETVPVTITFLVQPPDERMLEAYAKLGELKDEAGKRIGTIESAEITQLDPVHVHGAGDQYGVHLPTASDVILVVACEGTVFGDTVHVGSLNARVGLEIKLLGPGWQGNGYVVSVDRGAAATE